MSSCSLRATSRFACVFVACVLIGVASPLTARADGQLPGRQVWGHFIGHGMPDELLAGNSSPYGSSHPLDVQPPGATAATGPARQLPQAIDAGLTGMQILQFDGENTGTDWIDEWIESADETWRDDRVDFSIAPCILPKTYDGTLQMIRNYANFAKSRPSAATVDGDLVIYIYAGRRLSVEEWNRMRGVLAAEGTPVTLIGDLGTEASQHGDKINPASEPYVQAFDATWLFDDRGLAIFDQFTANMRAQNTPFAGGLMPGYNRETAGGGFEDARGTLAMRQSWNQHLKASPDWVNVVTWGDFVEGTEIRPSSDWNVTRSDINAFYAAKFRGQPPPMPSPQSYVTTPKFVRPGEKVDAEGLVLNGGSDPVWASVRLVDASGKARTEPVVSRVEPGEAADMRTSAVDEPSLDPGSVIYAQVNLNDANNNLLQSVISAPIIVYAENEKPTTPMRRTYYSIPARNALPNEVTLTVSGSSGTEVNSKINTSTSMHTLELLQNTRLASLEFDTDESRIAGPMRPQTIVGNQRVSATPDGYYVARAIDTEGRVGYSLARYIP